MKAANLVTATLADLGVGYLSGVIGSSIEDIVESVPGRAALRYLSVRHEQVASAMCDGYAKVSGKPMACIAHAGPGACNMLTGVASAFRDSVPMMVITGNLGSTRLGRDAWHELDVEAIYRPVTKWRTRVRRATDIEAVLRRAYAAAMEGRPGPVLVDIPQDMSAFELEENDSIRTAKIPLARGTVKPDADAIAETVRRIQAAAKPVLFAGGGVFWSQAWEALAQLAHRFNIPVTTTETARGVLAEDNPLCLGMVGLFGNPAANRAIKEADLVLGIGCRFSETTTFGWTSIPSGTPIIQVNTDVREIGRQFPVALGITADANAFLQALLQRLGESGAATPQAGRAQWLQGLQAARAADQAAFFDKASNATPIKPQAIIKELIGVAGREAVYCVGQGNLTSFCVRAPIFHPGSYLQSAGLGTLGYAFPAALGAQLAAPHRRVFCLTGDGDFASVMQDLETAARESLNVITLVFNNGGYGVNRLNQLARGVKPFGVDFRNPDFAAFARMVGMTGVRVERPQDITPALADAAAKEAPALIELIIDPAERVGANPKAVGLYT